MEPQDKTWDKVFNQLYEDREKLLAGTAMGTKEKYPIEKSIFFLGDITAILTKHGFNFEVGGKSGGRTRSLK